MVSNDGGNGKGKVTSASRKNKGSTSAVDNRDESNGCTCRSGRAENSRIPTG